MAEKREVNVGINHGNEAFFANGVSIVSNKDKFEFDFRQASQRLDDVGDKQRTTIFIKHNAIMVDPALAKGMLQILEKSIKDYEKNFGKLNLPKKEKLKLKKNIATTTPDYIH
jgi:hypothetical protein